MSTSVNGIVGIKPTVGLVESIWNYSLFQNSRYSRDQWRELVQMLQYVGVIAAIDESDPVTLESKGKSSKDYTSFFS
jgi:amidase